jgi:hypothetical protein
VKLLIEILLSIFLHPVAMILAWFNIVIRSDLTALKKVVWLLVTAIWGLGPILYVLVGDGAFF